MTYGLKRQGGLRIDAKLERITVKNLLAILRDESDYISSIKPRTKYNCPKIKKYFVDLQSPLKEL